jgi:hypothetical protein
MANLFERFLKFVSCVCNFVNQCFSSSLDTCLDHKKDAHVQLGDNTNKQSDAGENINLVTHVCSSDSGRTKITVLDLFMNIMHGSRLEEYYPHWQGQQFCGLLNRGVLGSWASPRDPSPGGQPLD